MQYKFGHLYWFPQACWLTKRLLNYAEREKHELEILPREAPCLVIGLLGTLAEIAGLCLPGPNKTRW